MNELGIFLVGVACGWAAAWFFSWGRFWWEAGKTDDELSHWKDHDKKVKRLSADIDGSKIRWMHLVEKHTLGTITEAEVRELMRLSERRYREDW